LSPHTSGAANYLLSIGAIDSPTYDTIYGFTRGRLYNGNYNGDTLQMAIERAVDMTIEFILNNPQLMTMKNTEDMFDYEDEMQHFCEECDDVLDSFSYGHLCEYCEQDMQENEDDEYEY